MPVKLALPHDRCNVYVAAACAGQTLPAGPLSPKDNHRYPRHFRRLHLPYHERADGGGNIRRAHQAFADQDGIGPGTA